MSEKTKSTTKSFDRFLILEFLCRNIKRFAWLQSKSKTILLLSIKHTKFKSAIGLCVKFVHLRMWTLYFLQKYDPFSNIYLFISIVLVFLFSLLSGIFVCYRWYYKNEGRRKRMKTNHHQCVKMPAKATTIAKEIK